jgi:hypothetical protein
MLNRVCSVVVKLTVLSMLVVSVGAAGCGSTGGMPGTGGMTRANKPVGSWAEWPMPNSQADVTAGAPNPESYMDNGDGTVTDKVTCSCLLSDADPRRPQRLAPPVANRTFVPRGCGAVLSKYKRHLFPLHTSNPFLVFVSLGRLVFLRVGRPLRERRRRLWRRRVRFSQSSLCAMRTGF